VLLSTYGEAQLTDFGIARISGGHETRSGLITASMAHAPPEVLDGHRPTVAADVYALGSTTFELMFGRPAFALPSDESMVPMLRRILTDPPPDLRAAGVPDAVCRALERAMAKAPDQRPTSAADLGRELQAARRSLGLDAGRLTVPAGVAPGRISVATSAPPAPPDVSVPKPGLPPPPVPGAQRPGSPTPAGRPEGSRPEGARPATVTLAASNRPVRPLPPPRPSGPGGQASGPGGPSGPSGRPTFAAPPEPLAKAGASRRALWSLIAMAVVLASVGAFVVKRGPWTGSSAPTTRLTFGSPSTRLGGQMPTDYNIQVENDFNEG
jgi:serine/threonine-protein kinase PknK